MTTVKIKPTHPSQGEFVVIEKAAFDPSKHELLEGESLGDAGGETGVYVPTLTELTASHRQLLARSDQLDDHELQLSQRALALDEREQALSTSEQRLAELVKANEAEAQRLRDELAKITAEAAAMKAAASTAEKPAKAKAS